MFWIKQIVDEYLMTTCTQKLDEGLKKLHDKDEKELNNLKNKNKLPIYITSRKSLIYSKEQFEINRKNHLSEICNDILSLAFKECTDTKLLDNGKVFCDRKTVFYHPSIIDWNSIDVVNAVVAAYLTSMQDYFILIQLNDSKKRITAYQTALMMYYIGMIDEKLWYNMQRSKMEQRVNERYPYLYEKYNITQPTQYQVNHMIKEIIDNKNEVYGKIDTSFSTVNVIEAHMELTYLVIHQYCGIKEEYYDGKNEILSYFTINDDGTYTRMPSNKIEIKEHKNVVETAKKMINVI